MEHDVNLGHEPYSFSKRDAIHIAVVPAVAGTSLMPGSHVELIDGLAYLKASSSAGVGIADPFRRSAINEGGRFWLCLYPKTIKSLRHHWSHPSFPDVVEDSSAQVQESVEWLKAYATRFKCYVVEERGVDAAYTKMMEEIRRGELYGEGTDCHGLWEVDDAQNLERHASVVLGYPVRLDGFEFTCSC